MKKGGKSIQTLVHDCMEGPHLHGVRKFQILDADFTQRLMPLMTVPPGSYSTERFDCNNNLPTTNSLMG